MTTKRALDNCGSNGVDPWRRNLTLTVFGMPPGLEVHASSLS
ncbi:MAG: hypothetical protein ABSG13_06055 [Bryobacteraceae bacterium]